MPKEGRIIQKIHIMMRWIRVRLLLAYLAIIIENLQGLRKAP